MTKVFQQGHQLGHLVRVVFSKILLLAGIVSQDARGPQRVAEVVAPRLQLRGHAPVEGAYAPVEEVVEGDQM